MERPQLSGTGYQPGLHRGPLQTFMAVQVFLKTVFQCSEQFFTLFWGQLHFIALHFVHGFTSSASANLSSVATAHTKCKNIWRSYFEIDGRISRAQIVEKGGSVRRFQSSRGDGRCRSLPGG
jgi:hypothetical protein